MLCGKESIDWDFVVGVDVACEKPMVCPICLEPAVVCPKITRCGHVLCWTCILRLFSSDYFKQQSKGNPWRKCPLCSDPIMREELRPVRFQQIEPIASEGNRRPVWTFVHVVRNRKTNRITCPLVHVATAEPHIGHTPFERFVICFEPLIFWKREFIALFCQRRLCLEFKHNPEMDIFEVCEELSQRLENYKPGLVAELELEADQLIARLTEERPYHAEYEILSDIAHQTPEPWRLQDWKALVQNVSEQVLEEADAMYGLSDASPSPGGTTLSEGTIQELLTSSEDFHVYQSWDGQLKFLVPSLLRLLIHSAGGDFSRLPVCLPECKLLSCAHHIVDYALKTKYPFLNHLPNGLSIEIYDSAPIHLLSPITISVYDAYLSNTFKTFKQSERRKIRQDKKYEQHVRDTEERRKALELERTQSISPNAYQVNTAAGLNDSNQFPSLVQTNLLPEQPATVPSLPTHALPSPKTPKQSFRDRVCLGELDLHLYPDIDGRKIRDDPVEDPGRDDPLPGNWRTGGPLIHRSKNRITDLSRTASKPKAKPPKPAWSNVLRKTFNDEFPSL
eukprot:Blabericola_migrator_1__3093@NODE_18_length_22925_cov_118_464826_g15_i0_p3_GENE_NODE_18_length_22925_cov_118_464826_g15_i0NODE_18_length_22925_cov_118_464826_g15_i0_p3_ORF_typecomplete_len563_score73_25zfC3HC4/PF00097_25/1_2e08zfC3HC4/PF00097_25/1_8e03zfC3HC4/PF00097_25/4_4e03zfC3HC4/PF00097_25/8_3e03zfC3HC4_3/PF13920_6/9_3e08zfC3HC4_3/PF13920_6/2_9e03zfRING_UBOX/PF13445_6/2e06zfRING_UBOX/PF13445_6/3_7e03zfRING_5/PF14634_6/2_1e06zfRING_5/PF14634_6/2_2e03zfRING_5/PF14634_6/1_3e03zfC3HC4_2/PF13923